jgi:hypothetical protein
MIALLFIFFFIGSLIGFLAGLAFYSVVGKKRHHFYILGDPTRPNNIMEVKGFAPPPGK